MRRRLKGPTKETLLDLYENQRLTTHEIGKQFNVAHIQVLRWMDRHGIKPRRGGTGLVARGIEPPTKEELESLVHEQYESYHQIAARYGVDQSAVMHWLKKHDIRRPTIWGTRRKGKEFPLPNESELRELYESGLSQDAIGELYGVSSEPIRRLFAIYAIQARSDSFDGGLRYQCKDGHSVRSSYEKRIDDWLYDNGVPHVYEPSLPFGNRMRSDFSANGWFIEVWGVTGSETYTEQKQRKIALYEEYQLPLIHILASDFDKPWERWQRRIRECLSNVKPAGMLF